MSGGALTSYNYDAAGNWSSIVRTTTTSYGSNVLNQYTSITGQEYLSRDILYAFQWSMSSGRVRTLAHGINDSDQLTGMAISGAKPALFTGRALPASWSCKLSATAPEPPH